MAIFDTLPTDSMLRRHALTERNRSLGLPPTDSALQRHYAQLQAALRSNQSRPLMPAQAVLTLPRVALAQASVTAPAVQRTQVPAPPPAAAGGLWGWLRRLLGAT